MVNEVAHDRDQLATVKDSQSALSVAVAGDKVLAIKSQEYMTHLDKHVEFLELDMYADWRDDKRTILECENRELSYRKLIRGTREHVTLGDDLMNTELRYISELGLSCMFQSACNQQ